MKRRAGKRFVPKRPQIRPSAKCILVAGGDGKKAKEMKTNMQNLNKRGEGPIKRGKK